MSSKGLQDGTSTVRTPRPPEVLPDSGVPTGAARGPARVPWPGRSTGATETGAGATCTGTQGRRSAHGHTDRPQVVITVPAWPSARCVVRRHTQQDVGRTQAPPYGPRPFAPAVHRLRRVRGSRASSRSSSSGSGAVSRIRGETLPLSRVSESAADHILGRRGNPKLPVGTRSASRCARPAASADLTRPFSACLSGSAHQAVTIRLIRAARSAPSE